MNDVELQDAFFLPNDEEDFCMHAILPHWVGQTTSFLEITHEFAFVTLLIK